MCGRWHVCYGNELSIIKTKKQKLQKGGNKNYISQSFLCGTPVPKSTPLLPRNDLESNNNHIRYGIVRTTRQEEHVVI